MSQASIPTPPNSMANATNTRPVLTLTDMVDSAAVNLKRVEFAKSALGAAIFMFTAVITVILIDHWVWALPTLVRWLCLGLIVTGTLYWMLRRVVPMFGRRINPIYAAREIERKVPELKDSLVSYMQLNESQNAAPKGVVTAVGKFAVDRLSRHDIGEFIASTTPLKLAMWLLATIVFSSVYFVVSPKSGFDSLMRLMMPWNKIEVPTRVKIVKLTPKDAVVARGQSLDIDIELRGHVSGDKVQIEFSTLDGQFVDQVILMEPVIEGLTYQGKLTMGEAGIEQPLEYKVRAGDSVAGPYLVEVEIVPLVAVEKLELSYPPYTKLPPRTLEEPSDFEAIEGTKVRVFAQANQKMDSGRIEVNPLAKDDDPLNIRQLVGLQTNDRMLNGSFQLQLNKKKDDPSPGSYRLNAISALGQPNADPIIYSYSVAADQAPVIEWADDYPDVVELPINHLGDFKVKAYDKDFRLSHIRTSLYRGRSKLDDTVLLHNEEGINATVERTWRFEPVRMGLRPGDQLTLQAFASDNRRDLQNTRWEPNISSTPILKIVIKPESNESTDISAPKDKAEPLPDQPVDGSDIDQPPENSPETSESAKENGSKDQAGEDSGASDGSENGEPQNGAESSEKGTEPSNPSSDNTGGEKSEEKNPSQDGSGEKSSDQDGQNSEQNNPQNQAESGQNQSNNGESGTTKPNGDASKNEPNNGGSKANGNQSSSPQPNNEPQATENTSQNNDANGNGNSSGTQEQKSGKEQSNNQQQGNGGQQQSKSEQSPQSMQQGNEGGQGEQSSSESGTGEQSSESGAGQNSSNSEPANSSQPSSTEGDSAGNESNSSDAQSSNGSAPQENGDNPANSKPSGNSSDASGDSQSASSSNSAEPNGAQADNANAGQQSNGQGNSSTSSNAKPSPANNNASNKSQSNGLSNGSNQSKGRLDEVSQANQDSKPPVDDGSAFEEIKKWMDQNGPPKPSNQSGESGSAKQPNEQSAGQGEGDQQSQSGKENQQDATGSNAQGGDQSTGASQSQSKSGDQESGAESASSSGESKEGGSTDSPGESKSQGPSPSQSTSQQSGKPGAAGNVSDSGTSAGAAEGSSAGPIAPSEANLEYTKELTDMALEYLDRQRDQPDPELLKRLGWSADDLRNFVDRWKAAKERGITPDGLKQDYMQDLRALGLTPNSASKRATQGADDKVRGLSEEGGRSKPPRSLQGQYEAFRRAAQQKATKE